jgi:hypothetical protein
MKSFKLLIGLADYKITFKKKVMADKQRVEGVCHFDKKKIEVDSTSPPDIQFTTFWHEWTHAALSELGSPELASNEPFVETLSQNIARTIRHLPPELK